MPFPGLLSSSATNLTKLCQFEIRPDDDFVVFRGAEDETPATTLKGTVVLMCTETMKLGGIRITLEGKRRTQHFITRTEAHGGLPATSMLTNKHTFMHQEIKFTDARGHSIRTLPPGNHEWSFEFPLAGNTSESVEGMAGNYIVYDLKATAERGVLAKDLVARKHMRVIRTIGPDAMESGASAAVHGVWPDKLKYLFEPMSKSIIFGTSVVTEIQLTPLIEKLGIEKVKFTLREVRKIRTDPGPDFSPSTGKWHGMWKEEADVFQEEIMMPDNCDEIDTDTQLPMFKFKTTWTLPKSLAQCRQSVEDNEWITIRHHAHYDVLLRNPDGHLSELKAHHPIRLFISPHLPVQENNSVSTSPHDVAGNDVDPLSDMVAPPTYGTHTLDQMIPLYDGIDPAGFFTPGVRSGAATPFGGFLSRNASSENLATLNNTMHNTANAGALHTRLRNLQVRDGEDGNTPTQQNGQQAHSYDSSPANGHHADNYFGTTSPAPGEAEQNEHVDYDMDALARMPSYNTAVKSHARPTVVVDGLPTYANATSRPPSPQLQPPRQAHFRSGHLTP